MLHLKTEKGNNSKRKCDYYLSSLKLLDVQKTYKLENLIVGLKFSVYLTLGLVVVISYVGKISPSLAHWIIITFNVSNRVQIQSSNLKIRKFQMNETLKHHQLQSIMKKLKVKFMLSNSFHPKSPEKKSN